MQVLFLGTSSMVPTRERNHSSILVSCGSECILVDCGEGTQRQLKIAGIKLTKISKILISHWHGDHVLGLPGLIQSMAAAGYGDLLEIYGPEGTRKLMKKMLEIFASEGKMGIRVRDIKPGKFFENEDFVLAAGELRHGIKTLGYSIAEKDRRKINMNYIRKMGVPEGPLLGKLQSGKEISWKGKRIGVELATSLVKGKRIAIVCDTVPCRGAEMLAKDSDLLVCEATYSSDLEGKAGEHCHMTAKQAAELAAGSRSKRLILTHFSPRYKDEKELEEDARSRFGNVSCARDFMKINV